MDETEVMLADAAEVMLKDRHDKERLRQVYQGRNAYSRALWREMAEQGWLAISLSEELGGSGLLSRHAAVIAKALGQHTVPEPFVSSAAMVACLANHLQVQNAAAWQPIIESLLSGDTWVAPAWQEFANTVGVAPTLQAQPDAAGTVRLQGVKQAVIAADMADHLLVTAFDGAQVQLWSVPSNAPGVALETALGSDGSSVARVSFSQVDVAPAQCLGRGDAVLQALLQAHELALVLTSAQLQGVAEQALSLTVEYMRTRQQFGKAIGSFQSLQHLAVDARVQQALGQAALNAALRDLDGQTSTTTVRSTVARAKARTAYAAQMAGRFGVQAHGAIGFAAEADIGLYLKSALRLSAYLGNSSHQRQHVAQELFAQAQVSA